MLSVDAVQDDLLARCLHTDQAVGLSELEDCLVRLESHRKQTWQQVLEVIAQAAARVESEPRTWKAVLECTREFRSNGQDQLPEEQQLLGQLSGRYLALDAEAEALEEDRRQQVAAVELQRRVAQFDQHLQAGWLVAAAQTLLALRQKLLQQPEAAGAAGSDHDAGPSGTDSSVHAAEDKEVRERCEEALVHTLDECFKFISVDAASGAMVVYDYPAPSGQSYLAEMWQALRLLGSATEKLSAIAEMAMTAIVPWLLSANAHPAALTVAVHQANNTPEEQMVEAPDATAAGGSAECDSATLQVLLLAAEEAEQEPAAQRHSCAAVDLACFLDRHVAKGDAAAASLLGKLLWPRLADALVAASFPAIAAAAAADATGAEAELSLEGFEEALAAAVAAEAEIGERTNLLGSSDDAADAGEDSLRVLWSRKVQQVRQQFTDAKKERFLVLARSLILDAPEEATLVVGEPLPLDVDAVSRVLASNLQEWEEADPPLGWAPDGKLLARGRYRVSVMAAGVLKLMSRALMEACCAEHRAEAEALLEVVVDMTTMLRQLPPTLSPGMHKVPLRAMLHFNDCVHVAQELLLMAYRFSPQLGNQLGHAVSFLPQANQLNAAALQCWQRQMDENRGHMNAQLAKADLQKLLEDPNRVAAAVRALQQAVSALRRLAVILRQLLAPWDFVEAVGGLLEHACAAAAAAVQAKQDISEVECTELPRILQPLTAPDLISGLARVKPRSSAAAAEVEMTAGIDRKAQKLETRMVAHALAAAAPSYSKLQELSKLLGTPLAEITGLWESGYLSKHGFTAHQVIRLIHATFADTPFRTSCLNRIR